MADWSGSPKSLRRFVVVALLLVTLLAVAALLVPLVQRGRGGLLRDGGPSRVAHRQRRDTDHTTTPPGDPVATDLAKSGGDYFPVYREVGGGRSVDWNGDQMSTDEFEVRSRTDFIDEDDEATSQDGDLDSVDYEYYDDELGPETSDSEEVVDLAPTGNASSSSSLRGKEFSDYYSDLDDGQKFDEDEYETTFIQPGMHYGDNVEIVEQVNYDGDHTTTHRRKCTLCC